MAELSELQKKILFEKHTESAFSGKYDEHFEKGKYLCANCGNILFESETKFNAGCGWPSFWEKADPNAIVEKRDISHFMIRTEVLCAKCGGHLGHIFQDGPEPTGKRYCINSGALEFVPITI